MLRRAFLAALLASMAAPGLASGEEPRRRTGGPSFIAIQALTANAARTGGRRGVLTVDLGLDCPDPAVHARAETLIPRLRAELFAQLQTYAAGLRPGEPPNPDFLATRFQAIADRTLGRGGRVLLGSILLS